MNSVIWFGKWVYLETYFQSFAKCRNVSKSGKLFRQSLFSWKMNAIQKLLSKHAKVVLKYEKIYIKLSQTLNYSLKVYFFSLKFYKKFVKKGCIKIQETNFPFSRKLVLFFNKWFQFDFSLKIEWNFFRKGGRILMRQ